MLNKDGIVLPVPPPRALLIGALHRNGGFVLDFMHPHVQTGGPFLLPLFHDSLTCANNNASGSECPKWQHRKRPPADKKGQISKLGFHVALSKSATLLLRKGFFCFILFAFHGLDVSTSLAWSDLFSSSGKKEKRLRD